MDVIEALDREVIVERAEAVRFWLLGFHLSSRATGAIQRELSAIIDNDPGAYMNGQRPLAGLTVADFIAELHRPNSGAVGRVKSVGYAALNELRAKIPADTRVGSPQAAPEPEYTVPELDDPEPAAPLAEAPAPTSEAPRPRGRPRRAAPAAGAETIGSAPPSEGLSDTLAELAAAIPGPVAEAPQAEDAPAEAFPARRRPGRPKGSRNRARNGVEAPQMASTTPIITIADVAETPDADTPKPRRGRPRRKALPLIATTAAPEAPAAAASDHISAPSVELAELELLAASDLREGKDSTLTQIVRLWPSLHPHARRAVAMYVSTLWAEDAYEG